MMTERDFWVGLMIVLVLAIVALNIIERDRRPYLTDAQKREEDKEVDEFLGQL